MGARVSRKATLPFNPSDYEEVHPKHNSNDLNDMQHYRILKHIRTGIEMEEYKLQFNDEQQYNEFYDAFEWRLTQEFIVNTCYFIENNRKEFCSTHYGAYLYTERIPIKLSEIKDIPFPDNLYILYTALEGFHTIYHKTGFFEIQEHMVCINRQGKVKIWINDNLSKKYPESIYTQIDGSEEDMVQRIIEIIDDNTDGTSQPISVSQYMAKHINRPNFNDAKMLLRQYAKEHAVIIPKSFECILEVLNSDYNRSEMTDSRAEDIKTFHGKGSRNQAPSFLHSRRNNLKSRSRGAGNYRQDISQADSRSQKSIHHQNFQQYKQSQRNGLVEVPGSRIPRLTHPIPQIQTGTKVPHHLVQSRFQQTSTGFFQLPNYSLNLRPTNTFLKNHLPVIAEGRPIIQHVHYPVVSPGTNSPMPGANYASPVMTLQSQSQIRPQFHSIHQQPETIISPTPSQQYIQHHVNTQDPRLLNKERRLNIYSDSQDSQMAFDSQSAYEAHQQQAYAMAYATVPLPIRHVAVVQHHYNVNQPPYQPPYTLNNNNIINRPEYMPQQVVQHNIYDSSQVITKSNKQNSVSRSKKHSSDAENSRDMSRKKRISHNRHHQSSDLSQTDEQYDDDRHKNRRKWQQVYYKRQEHVIDEDQDDDEEEQRIRKSRRREKKYRGNQAKLKMYREREEQQFRRMRQQQQEEEYRRRRQEDQFRRRREEEEFRRKLEKDELERLERKAADDFQRQLRFEEEALRQKQRQEEYLSQKHREELEYNRSRDYQKANQRYKSEASSYHQSKRSNVNRANASQHQSSAGIGMVSANRDETRTSNHLFMQTGQRIDEPFRYRTQAATFMYYSSEQDHQLDPEIARDLMIMQL